MARNWQLPHVDSFPYLICRPCERRLNNTISFKNVISETQKSLVKDSRFKRCPEVSLSVAISSANVAAVESRRSNLAFILTLSMCPPRVMKLDLPHLYPCQ
jgi:hypothetical protein